MSKHYRSWLIIGLSCVLVPWVLAQEEPLTKISPKKEENAPQIKRNPFTSQIPVKEEITVTEGIKNEDIEIVEEIPKPITDIIPNMPVQPIEVKVSTPKLNITGLIWNSDRPQAIVNGNIVGVGDRLFGVPSDSGEVIPEITIEDITNEGLLVSFASKTIVLRPVIEETPQAKKEKKR
ncbi:MAG TPA: hypothetical protein VI749_06365 [Candidatus Omnitrophota bacterium]|nr:hypothetical protein [Candidatus Omnitrophota bacterium]